MLGCDLMDYFDVSSFVAKLEGMGLKLTTIPLADGTIRINKWKLPDAAERPEEIEKMWLSAIGENQARIGALAAHLSRPTPPIHTSSKPAAAANLAASAAGLAPDKLTRLQFTNTPQQAVHVKG